jgi:hypothetical protein
MRAEMNAQVSAFAAQREEVMTASDEELKPIVEDALDEYRNGVADWFDAPIEAAAVLWWETFEYEQGRLPTATELAEFQSTTATVLDRTSMPSDPLDPNQVDAITGWLSAYALNSATAAGGGDLEWVTRQDGDVRDIHVPLDGDQVADGGTFNVAGHRLRFPGEPVGPPHVWINCRCVVRQVKEGEMTTNTAAGNTTVTFTHLPDGVTAAGPGAPAHPELDDDPGENDTGEDQEVDGEDYDELASDVPWHGVIAPTGVMSGDRRKFAVDALRNRELPLPVKFQKADDEGHKGSVVVANMTNVEERDGLIRAEGMFHTSSDSNEAIDLIANQMLRGLSVDLDDATFELQYEDGRAFDMNDEDNDPVAVVTDGRIASVTLCSIPAFQEAYIALGTWADAEADDATLAAAGCLPCAAREMDALYAEIEDYAISEASWDGSPSRFTDEEYYRSCVVHKNGTSTAKDDNSLPILEPNGDLNRAAVHAAAGRVDQVDAPPAEVAKGKRSLITAYRKLKEDPPESLTATAFVETFAPGTKDGPGWVTNPKETQRLRTYWTRGKGAAKIRWGAPGDFNRCRRQLAKYVPNPEYLAGTCANLHKEAMGIWPGQEGGKRRHAGETITAAAFSIVASAAADLPSASWFTNPELEAPTPLTIDGRRIYGHVAAWTSCHTGYGISVGDGEVCVRPPSSPSGYAYFHTGELLTDDGMVNVGHITMDTGHAPSSMAGRVAASHYDNTGAVIADVVAGEDEHGIWFSGALRSEMTDAQRIAIGAAALSGDWRRLGGAYELIAALAVNVPGFPIPRTAIAASGTTGQYTLVAAGIVQQDDTPSMSELVRKELALVRAEDARAVLRAQTIARVHHLQAENARARLHALTAFTK